MLIDIHAHIWGKVDDVETIMKAVRLYEIDKVAVSSLVGGYDPTVEDIRMANRQVCICMHRYPEHILGFSYINPAHEERALDEFKRCIEEYGMVGMKLWVAVRCTDERLDPLIAQAIEYDVPVLIHTWVKATGNLPEESTPMDLSLLAKRFPEATFIMAHLGGDWEYGVKAIRSDRNVLADICGSIAETGMTESAVRELGADRLVFGSDMTGIFLPNVGKILGAAITEEEREQIFWRNATRILKHGF